jgi:histidinol-phosphate aminotransferase
MKIEQLVRPNINLLKAYSSAREEYTGAKGIFLDANENPFGQLNRYPDPYQRELKQKIAELKSVDEANIFIGNGSDEAIDLAFRIFCTPGKDKALSFYPTYGMYEVSAAINDVEMIQLPLDAKFQIDLEKLKPQLNNPELKIIFICSPNNPTGNNLQGIEFILNEFKGIIIIDEAYIDFSSKPSFSSQLEQYPNLIVLQTLSKAYGLAALRIGIAMASQDVISYFNKVKPPYNISTTSQKQALKALSTTSKIQTEVKKILVQRDFLVNELSKLSPLVSKIYPSDTNFLLLQVSDANLVYQALVDEGIIIRNRHSVVKNTLRITVGRPTENKQLIKALNKIYEKNIISRP